MKLTATQLRKIIKEEAQKSTLREADVSPVLFYTKKKQSLIAALKHLYNAAEVLQQLSEMEVAMAGEEDADVRSAAMDLDSLTSFVEDIRSATDSMVLAGSRK